jgi:hypothetical protein
VPKSSSAKHTPTPLSRSIESSAFSRLPSKVLSVSSSSSRSGSKAISPRMRSIASTKSGRRNCSGDTLTETARLGQLRPSRQARRRMYSPSSTMRPECSATGIKHAGGISPCTGAGTLLSVSAYLRYVKKHRYNRFYLYLLVSVYFRTYIGHLLDTGLSRWKAEIAVGHPLDTRGQKWRASSKTRRWTAGQLARG